MKHRSQIPSQNASSPFSASHIFRRLVPLSSAPWPPSAAWPRALQDPVHGHSPLRTLPAIHALRARSPPSGRLWIRSSMSSGWAWKISPGSHLTGFSTSASRFAACNDARSKGSRSGRNTAHLANSPQTFLVCHP